MTRELLQQLAENPDRVLRRGHRAEIRIKAKQDRIRKWRELAESITANPENGSSGSGFPQSKIENCVVNILAIEEDILTEIKGLRAVETEAAEIIAQLSEQPNYKTVLELRYLNHMTYEQISVTMSYTFRWTQELLRRALDEVKKNAQDKAR